jgi:hypothetical protein
MYGVWFILDPFMNQPVGNSATKKLFFIIP